MQRKTFKAARRMIIASKISEMCEAIYGLRRCEENETSVPEEMVAELDELLGEDEELFFTPEFDIEDDEE
jgi:hypothetical protein